MATTLPKLFHVAPVSPSSFTVFSIFTGFSGCVPAGVLFVRDGLSRLFVFPGFSHGEVPVDVTAFAPDDGVGWEMLAS
jgi:hypothetical protein